VGNDHDRGELTDFVLDAALWLCVILSARSCTQRSHYAAYLSWDCPVCVDPDRRVGLVVDLPERGDVPAGFDPELTFTINQTKKATLRRVAFLLLVPN